ncbi:MAG: hypothetical protein JRJ87_12790 [Deltaproteobacteria bacterium]|nr:hypothetical protein [Deltaproteobacteria bacterium]
MRCLLSCLTAILFVCGFSSGCEDKAKKGKQEELTIVVEADRTQIAEEERALKNKLTEFEQAREQLRKEKADLMSSKTQLKGHDKAQVNRLAELERKLWKKEREMWSRESTLESERKNLADQKDEILGRASGGSGGSKPANMAQREGRLASREKSLASRETDLSKREKEIAIREAELAKREAAFLKLKTNLASYRAPTMSASRGHGPTVSRRKAEKVYKATLARMRKRGILLSDLPLESFSLNKEIRQAKKEGDYSRMMDSIEQLKAMITGTKVDAEFIDRKFQRLAQLTNEKRPKGKDKQTVSSLLRKATQLYGDGKFILANRELNRIFGLLAK